MSVSRTELIEKLCIVCHAPFNVCPPGKRSRFCTAPYDSLYCSRDCRHAARFRTGTEANILTPTEAAYIAGFLDGEGSVILYMRRDTVALRVGFANNKPSVLEWIEAKVGIGTVITNKHLENPLHAQSYLLNLNSAAACGLLEQVAPYLIIKRPQALLAIEFYNRLRDPALKADRAWQYDYREQMRAMNVRGVTTHQT